MHINKVLLLALILMILIFPLSLRPVNAQPQEYYVPVTINEGSSVVGPVQLNLTIDPSLYSSYLSQDMGNIRFVFPNGTYIHAWLESYNGSTPVESKSALIWLSFQNGLPAGSTKVLMVFEPQGVNFDGYWWGEAPQLSPVYAEYDNGMYVFDYYTNFLNNQSLKGWDLNGTINGFAYFNRGLWLNAGMVYGYQFTLNQSYTGNYTVDALEQVPNATVTNGIGSDNVYPGISFNQLSTSNYSEIPPGDSGGFQEAIDDFPTFTEYLSTTNSSSNNIPSAELQTRIPITSPAVFTLGFIGKTVFSQINYSYTLLYKNSSTSGPNYPGLATLAIYAPWLHVYWFRVRSSPSSSPSSVSISGSPQPLGVTLTFNVSGINSQALEPVLTVDGNNYTTSQLPVSITVPYGSRVNYSFLSPISVGASERFVWSSTSGLSTVQSGFIVATTSGSIVGNYLTQYYVSVSANPSAGALSLSPQSGWYNAGTQLTFSETPNAGAGDEYVFTGWTGTYTTSATSFSETVNEPIIEVANYNLYYYLTMEAGAGLTVSPSSGWYLAGSSVQISASGSTNGNTRYNFVSWTGSGSGSYSGTNNPATVTMNAPITEYANSQTQYYVSVSSQYGTPQGAGWYDAGSTATISVNSPVSDGSGAQVVFVSWTGTLSSSSNPYSFTVNEPVSETAQWAQQYYFNISVNPSSAGHAFPSSGWYNAGSSLAIGALQYPGYKFEYWSGYGNGSYSGGLGNHTIIMNSPINENAVFYLGLNVTAFPGGSLIASFEGKSYNITGTTLLYLPYGTNISVVPVAFNGYYFSGFGSQMFPNFTLKSPTSLRGNFEKYDVISLVSTTELNNSMGLYAELIGPQGETYTLQLGAHDYLKPGAYLLVVAPDQLNQTPFTYYFGTTSLGFLSSPKYLNITGNGEDYRLVAVDPVSTLLEVKVYPLWDEQACISVSVINSLSGKPIPFQEAYVNIWSTYGNITREVNTGANGVSTFITPYVHGGTYYWRATYYGNSSLATDPSSSLGSLTNSLLSSTIEIKANNLPNGTAFTGSVGSSSFVSFYHTASLKLYLGTYSFNLNPIFTTYVEYIPSAYPSSISLLGPSTISVNYTEYCYIYIASSNTNEGYTVGQGAHWYSEGSTINISAVPNAGYKFEKWIVVGQIYITDPNSPQTEAVISGPGIIVAEFK